MIHIFTYKYQNGKFTDIELINKCNLEELSLKLSGYSVKLSIENYGLFYYTVDDGLKLEKTYYICIDLHKNKFTNNSYISWSYITTDIIRNYVIDSLLC